MAERDLSHQLPDLPVIQRIQIEELAEHLGTLETKLVDGGHIELLRGSVVVADVRAPEKPVPAYVLPASARPDFMARLKQMWGDRVFEDSTELIRRDRDGDL